MGTKAAGIGITGIGQVHIRARDLDRAVSFYRDTLELPFLFRAPPGMAFFQCGDVRLMLGVPEKPELDHPASIIYYRVADIHPAYRALEGRGVGIEAEPALVHKSETEELWLAFLRDSEDNLLALMSEVLSR